MIIGFLGKGGSGKSTLSTNLADFLVKGNNTVLAIDADHNMDFSFNLGVGNSSPTPYLGNSLSEIKDLLGHKDAYHYRDIFLDDIHQYFTLSPLDPFTEKYSTPLHKNLRVMATGPHTDNVLYGQSCSHSLGTSLKVYLPLLTLKPNEYVIIDEKAGRDGAGTGVTTGFDIAVVVVEPTPHSLKAGKQIAELLDFFDTKYVFVVNQKNQTSTTVEDFDLPQPPISTITPDDIEKIENYPIIKTQKLQEIRDKIGLANTNKANIDRLEKTIKKFTSNLDFETTNRQGH